MLRDLVTRLEDHDASEKLMHEAAAEIKSLRSKLDSAAAELRAQGDAWHEQEDELQSLRSRLDRIKDVIYDQFAKGKCSELVAVGRIEKIVAEELRAKVESAVEKHAHIWEQTSADTGFCKLCGERWETP